MTLSELINELKVRQKQVGKANVTIEGECLVLTTPVVNDTAHHVFLPIPIRLVRKGEVK